MINHFLQPVAEGTAELLISRCKSAITPSMNQIDDSLGLTQIHATIQERPLGKLTRFCGAAASSEQILEDLLAYERIAVAADLEDILARIRIRLVEERVKHVIDKNAGMIMVISSVYLEGQHSLAENCLDQLRS